MRSLENLTGSRLEPGPGGCARGSKIAESAHVFASRAFVTVTLAANMGGGMWTRIVFEKKSDRVQPHGALFPRQLVTHSPTYWITQEALLNMIDATLVTPSSHLGSCSSTVRHSALLRNFVASCATPAKCDTPSGTSRDTLSRWTGRTCAPSRTRSAKR